MKPFKGFKNSESMTEVPDVFFRGLLQDIQDVDELKMTAYALWRIENSEGPFRGLGTEDIAPEQTGLSEEEIRSGLEKAARRGSLVRAEYEGEAAYFLNSPQGRASAKAFAGGRWPEKAARTSRAPIERPNIFKLYEENIGPLTPMIADALKDAEETYPPEWVAEAIEAAVKYNKRNWKYCEAILRRWKEEGRAEKQDRRDAEEDRSKYLKGKYADIIKH